MAESTSLRGKHRSEHGRVRARENQILRTFLRLNSPNQHLSTTMRMKNPFAVLTAGTKASVQLLRRLNGQKAAP